MLFFDFSSSELTHDNESELLLIRSAEHDKNLFPTRCSTSELFSSPVALFFPKLAQPFEDPSTVVSCKTLKHLFEKQSDLLRADRRRRQIFGRRSRPGLVDETGSRVFAITTHPLEDGGTTPVVGIDIGPAESLRATPGLAGSGPLEREAGIPRLGRRRRTCPLGPHRTRQQTATAGQQDPQRPSAGEPPNTTT